MQTEASNGPTAEENTDPVVLNKIAIERWGSFQKSNQPDVLDEAIVYIRKALHLCSPTHASYPTILSNLTFLVDIRWKLHHEINDLEEVIAHYHQGMPFLPSRSVNKLSLALFSRYQALGAAKDLEDAIAYMRKVVLSCSLEDSNRPNFLATLGCFLWERSQEPGRMEDIAHSIRLLREFHLYPAGHHQRSTTLTLLALASFSRFMQCGVIGDLSDAIAYGAESLSLHPGPSNRSSLLNILSGYLRVRFEKCGNMEDLELGIKYQREAVALDPEPNLLDDLANLLHIRFKQLGGIDDLSEAIKYSQKALRLGNENDFFRLNNHGTLLLARFAQSGQMGDLDDGIDYNRKALDSCLPGDTNLATALSNVAFAIESRFSQTGSITDLDEAIGYTREALLLQIPGNPGHFPSLNNLAWSLVQRFQHSGKQEDLEDGIDHQRKALDACLPGDSNRGMALSNLAWAIRMRFNQTGSIADLDEAIMHSHEALLLHIPGNPKRFFSLNSLAKSLLIRFERSGRMEDLVDAGVYMREGLVLCPPGNINRADALANLAGLIGTHFQHLGGIGDLDDAIKYDKEALSLRPHGHPDRWRSLDQLALDLSRRFDELCQADDLKNAVICHSEAETVLPPDHPQQVILQPHIAATYLLQYRSHHRQEHLTVAFQALERAARHPSASSVPRFEAALQWISAARQYKHDSSLRAYSHSLIALDRCLATRFNIESQREFLSKIPKSLALDAAACAITDGMLEKAVELLEQGRAIVWARLRGYRHSLEKLADTRLAEEFQMLSTRLEQEAMSSDHAMKISSEGVSKQAGPPVSTDEKMKQHRILSEQWDSVVNRIREQEGFSDFLRPVPFTTLQQAAHGGPVVIINISMDRSDAIILCSDCRPPTLVPLPNATPQNLAILSTQLSEARAGDVDDCPKLVYGVLRALWELVVLPVKDKLVELKVVEGTRIWWCPTSELCGLPLHAAGPYSRQKNFPDIYVSSYTPSLSALISARADLQSAPPIPKMLVIGQATNLPRVNDEISAIQEFHISPTVLRQESATPETVLSAFKLHSWIHFACHGIQALQPYKSSFLLHDNKHMTLLELITARLPDAEFAFLSACHTAAGDLHGTPDEIIHLVAALQFCGFRSVVGTLWAMGDLDAPHIARDFYKYMFRRPGSTPDFRDAAIALNRATRQMRVRGVPVDRWVNFVHIGA